MATTEHIYRVYRLSRTLPKVQDPPQVYNIKQTSSSFSFFPMEFSGFRGSGREESGGRGGRGRRRERGGEGGGRDRGGVKNGKRKSASEL